MDNQQQPHLQEVDIVDLAVVLYRRKVTLIVVVILCMLLGLGVWYRISQRRVEITAVIVTGSKFILNTKDELLFSLLMSEPQSAQLLKFVYLPEEIKTQWGSRDLLDIEDIVIEHDEPMKGKIYGSGVVRLVCKIGLDNEEAIIRIMNNSLELLLETHKIVFESYENQILEVITKAKSKLEIMQSNQTLQAPVKDDLNIQSKILSLQTTLSASTQSKYIKRASSTPIERKPPLVFVACGLISGFIIGCFIVFFLELYAKAKIRATELA